MTNPPDLSARLKDAANALRRADALLIGAGAGMGVDSGLPDFRGPEGFWKAYPPFRGRQFSELSTPHWFQTDPALAWGFFGHRLNLYRAASPHAGFGILRRWGEQMRQGYFVYTSNVDGQFQNAGFPEQRVMERHGSIHHLQCSRSCSQSIWPASNVILDVDESTIRSRSKPPICPRCGAIARPNILMFGDGEWILHRSAQQSANYRKWLGEIRGSRVVAVELGAGLAIPTVRKECESQSEVLIRINPGEADTAAGGISLQLGALEALARIDEILAAA
jgi:NAD-dependent SIR2 family protein deacetylase